MSNKRKMKNEKRLKPALMLMVFIATAVIASSSIKTTNQNKNLATNQNFIINSYNVILDVKEDNKVLVEEDINVSFKEDGYHGITRDIKSWLEYTGKDNKTIKRKSAITELSSSSTYISKVNKDAMVKIGNPNETLKANTPYTYKINYIYDMGKDPFSGFDEFIFHAYGDHWNTKINNASITIKMPNNFDANNIKFFADKYRKQDITDKIDYTISNNTITAKVKKEEYTLYKSLTVDILLPENYFIGGTNNYGIYSLLCIIIILAVTIIIYILWHKYGKDYPKPIETLEFYPPQNYDASEIGYIYNEKQPTKKLIVALIVQLASKGYIKIDEKEDKKVVITNLATDDNAKSSTIKKSALSINESIVYKELFLYDNVISIADSKQFYLVINKVMNNLCRNLRDKIEDIHSTKCAIYSFIAFFLIDILWILSFSVFEDLNPKYSILYLISFICIIIVMILTLLMNRKTEYGEQITAKVLGFKKYLETVKKEEIDKVEINNPNYFYEILPYAYVLDASKAWTDKFASKIPVPQHDMGTFNYLGIMYTADYLIENLSSPNSDSSSGCSSCGGGGGGCSSCGGGGAW